MPKIADRVAETTSTAGTGAFTLGGASLGFRTFASAFSVGDKVYYAAASTSSTEFEVGVGTLGPGTLTRDTVLMSSNSGALVNFSAGAKDVFCSVPARLLAGGSVEIPFTTAISFTGNEQMPQQTVAGALAFTVDTAGAIDGAVVQVDLIANGTNAPTFSAAFRQWGGSQNYDNRAGIRNSLTFFRRSGVYYYTVAVAIGAVAESGPVAPSFSTAPVITGTAAVGATLSYTSGTYAGVPTPTSSQQWTLDGVNISGATGSTYVVQAGDAGKVIRVRQTATNTSGSVSNTSAGVTVTAATAPAVVSAPAITGTPTAGSATSFTAGSFSGSPTPTLTQQWTIDGVDVSGATGATYTPISGDAGKALRVRQTATNSAGSVSSTSAPATVAAASAPSEPQSLSATPSITSIALTWAAPATAGGTVTDYVVQYAAAGTSFAAPTTFADGTSTALSATITGLASGTAYDVRVAAVNGAGTGPWAVTSNVTTTTPTESIVTLQNLVNLTASGDTYTSTNSGTSFPCRGNAGALSLAGDGYISVDLPATMSGAVSVLFGFDAASGVTSQASLDCSCWIYTTQGIYYTTNASTGTKVSGSVAADTNGAAGLRYRLRRAGTTVTIDKTTNGGTSWTTIHTFSGSFSGTLYPYWFAQGGAAAIITNPRALGLA